MLSMKTLSKLKKYPEYTIDICYQLSMMKFNFLIKFSFQYALNVEKSPFSRISTICLKY